MQLTYLGQTASTPDIIWLNNITGSENRTVSVPNSRSPIGAIVGGVVGGLLVLAIIILAVLFCLYRERRRKRQESQAVAEQTVAGTQYLPGPGPSGYGPVAQEPMQQAPPQPQYHPQSKVSHGDPVAIAGTPLPAYHRGSYMPLSPSDSTVPLPSPDIYQLDGRSASVPPTAISQTLSSANSEAHLSGVQPTVGPIYEVPGNEARR